MFRISRCSSGVCEVRFDFQSRCADEVPQNERRAFIRLSRDLDLVNTWLKVLAVGTRYSPGTIYEYAKALLYTLEWLAQEPVNAFTKEPVWHSLLSLKRSDLRTLFAWLDIPAKKQAEREHFVRTGELPPGYREIALSPSTRNSRNAALSSFYDWILFEYSSESGESVGITHNPLKDIKHHRSRYQKVQLSEGVPSSSQHWKSEHSSPLRCHQTEDGIGPVVLSPNEFNLVLAAIPFVSHGRNAANRNGALIRLLLWAMLRKEEIAGVKWEAVEGNKLWVVGKGGKRRVIPIADASAWGYLKTYTNELRIPLDQRFHGPLLRQLDHEDRPITRHSIEHLINSLSAYFLEEATSVKIRDPAKARAFMALAGKLHCHVFRSTGATFYARAGMSIITLSMLLGHSDPSTTKRYYISTKQIALSDEVQRICDDMAAALEAKSPTDSRHNLPDPRSWYRRRGLIQ